MPFLLQSEPGDTLSLLPDHPFLQTIKILHHPEEVVFNNRPLDLDLFVEFDQDSLESVSLFLKTNIMSRYREIPLSYHQGRYTYRYNPRQFPRATSIRYFFIITMKDYSIFATPLDSAGYIHPVKRALTDPVKYYEWKRAQNR